MNNEIFETAVAPSSELKIDVIQLKKAALILRAINHKLRQQILKLIHQNGKMTVTEIYVKLRLEQSVASQHLAILRKAGYVNTLRDGKFIFYSVNYSRLDQVHSIVHDLLK
jgi:DNA-binding transcriptional ArsR family regulator